MFMMLMKFISLLRLAKLSSANRPPTQTWNDLWRTSFPKRSSTSRLDHYSIFMRSFTRLLTRRLVVLCSQPRLKIRILDRAHFPGFRFGCRRTRFSRLTNCQRSGGLSRTKMWSRGPFSKWPQFDETRLSVLTYVTHEIYLLATNITNVEIVFDFKFSSNSQFHFDNGWRNRTLLLIFFYALQILENNSKLQTRKTNCDTKCTYLFLDRDFHVVGKLELVRDVFDQLSLVVFPLGVLPHL